MAFHPLTSVLQRAEALNCDKVKFLIFFLLWIVLLLLYLRNLYLLQCHKDLFLYFLLGGLGFTFWPLIHFYLIFVYSEKCRLKLFIFSIWLTNCSSTICQHFVLFTDLTLHLCPKSVVHACMDLFLCFLVCSIDLLVYFYVTITQSQLLSI